MSNYVPALSFRWLTPIYDPLLRWGMHEADFKQHLIARSNIRPGQQVLDLGCGTGTLTLMIKQSVPDAIATGLDGDPQVLEIARRKSARLGLDITWSEGMAFALPFPDKSFDLVLSSLVVHHLALADKLRAFREVFRVLRPAGSFQVVDFGRPSGIVTRLQARAMRNREQAADNFAGRLVPLMLQAGFTRVAESDPRVTIFGPLWFYSASR